MRRSVSCNYGFVVVDAGVVVVAGFTFVTTTLPSGLVAMTTLPLAEDVVDTDELFAAAAAVAAFFARACSTIARALPLDVVVVVAGVVVVIDGVALIPAVTLPADALTGATTLGVAIDVAIGDGDEVAATVGVVMAADATVGVSAPVPAAV
jgi:hypothetical protein